MAPTGNIYKLWINKNKNNFFGLIVLLFITCQKEEIVVEPPIAVSEKIAAVDISFYPQIATSHTVFYNSSGQSQDFLQILKSNKINTIRLRLWVHPFTTHSSFDEVKQFSQEVKNQGFKTWITLHYSDTWADPSQQTTPSAWQSLSFNILKDSVFQYTRKVVSQLQPDYVQIGNEINNGFLFPYGNITASSSQFKTLLTAGIQSVRQSAPQTKIIIHFSGINNSDWFFNQISDLDYDFIGLSYYPIWHGADLISLKNTLQNLSQTYHKKIVIAETAYPFTLDYNDWTNNVVGLESQLILPQFPATLEGQKQYLLNIKKIVNQEVTNGFGLCYWGAEWVAWRGHQATDGSTWENQALFDFQNKATPALSVIGD